MNDRIDTAGRRALVADTPQPAGFGGDQQDRAGIRVSEHRFRRLFEGVPIGMAIFNETHQFVEVNHALANMLWYTEAELVGRSIQDITHPDDIGLTAGFLDRIDSPGTTSRQTEKPYLRKDGETVFGKVTALAIHDESGAIMFAVGIIEDVTEMRMFEAALRKAREAEAARQVEKARLEGVLLTVRESAHQIGKRLNQAQGFTELTLLRSDLSPPTRQMLELAMEGLTSVTQPTSTVSSGSFGSPRSRPRPVPR